MSGMAKSFSNGFFHNLDDYCAIGFIDVGPITISHDKAIYIDYQSDLVKFIDGDIELLSVPKKDVEELLLACDCFCEYLGIGVKAAYSELRQLVNTYIFGKGVQVVGQVN